MKTKMMTLFTGLICFFITSCNQLEPVEPSPVLNIFASPEVVKYGGDVTITWSSENSDYCMMNNVKIDPNGSMTFKNLTTTTKFNITAIGKVENVKKTLTVTVIKPDPPKVKILIESAKIIYGEKASFEIITEGIVNSITVNDIPFDNKTFYTPALFKNEEYNVVVKGPGGIAQYWFKIFVGNWRDSKYGLLCEERPFFLESSTIEQNGVIVWDTLLDEDQLTRRFYFYINGTYEVIDASGKLIGNGKWSFLDNNQIDIAGTAYMIFELTKDRFVIKNESSFKNIPSVYTDVYYRKGN